ncbi:hypothetical protein M758_8G106900 [Ceratodon purpureus]|uniref:Uncharacterized protein n=1 Tax=Ceratodon purpureus TaxID=3225 RepID=A0A8T0H0V2_CERPU|nr:hypothetical protein KC19_8G110300 [Ceratodon purpureus]KAG0608450.1 hypothetical protein M758_8G106900 [Ceratodon purpureus]
MEQQAMAGSASSLTPPTSSASTASLGGIAASAGGSLLASTADSLGVTGENNATVLPPRRRLGKIAARTLSETKREGVGGPPGFGQAASATSPLTSPGAAGLPSAAGVGAAGGFRERVALRSSGKADLAGEQHGVGGSSKPGRSPHTNTGPLEARHLGRRPEVQNSITFRCWMEDCFCCHHI